MWTTVISCHKYYSVLDEMISVYRSNETFSFSFSCVSRISPRQATSDNQYSPYGTCARGPAPNSAGRQLPQTYASQLATCPNLKPFN